MKVTQWFDPAVRPVHRGVYELENLVGPFLYWNGEAWLGAGIEPNAELKIFGRPHPFGTGYPSTRRWRGLAEKP